MGVSALAEIVKFVSARDRELRSLAEEIIEELARIMHQGWRVWPKYLIWRRVLVVDAETRRSEGAHPPWTRLRRRCRGCHR